METKINEIEVNGLKYIPKGSAPTTATNTDGLPFVLVRGYGSGVQYGYLKSRKGCEVELVDARRIWSWNKATETSQIAVDGISKTESKVTVSVPEKSVLDVIEIFTITGNAIDNLKTQPIWKK
jgi:hypothetical protein